MQNNLPAPSGQRVQPLVNYTTIMVSSLAQLQTELENAGAYAALELVLTTGFPITTTIVIQNNQTVSITSGAGGPYTLTREANGSLFSLPAFAGGRLTLLNIIIDGNGAAYPTAGGSLISGEAGSIITIGEGAELINNFQTGSGGAISLSNGTINMTGGRVAGNRSTFGGGISTENSFFYMLDGVVEDNEATSSGGGIYMTMEQLVMLGGTVRNNTANQYGGGISIDNGTILMENAVIFGNTAQYMGGGMQVGGAAGSLSIISSVVEDNTSLLGDGGGIYIASSNPAIPTYNVSGDSFLAGNIAPSGNGGAIGLIYEDGLGLLNIGPAVVFTENFASQAYLIDSADIPLHNARVQTRSFTSPFEYGFNNFDIQYTRGTQVTLITVTFEVNSGSAVPSQTVISGTPAAQPPNPTRAGYAFCGWFADFALTIPFNFASPIAANTTLYACWQMAAPTQYSVNFNTSGGTAVPSQIVNAGSPAAMPANPMRGSDIFAGWYTSPDFSAPWNFANPVTSNITLFARWITSACPPACRPACPKPCPPSNRRLC